MNRRLFLIIFIGAWLALPAQAQKDDMIHLYNEAEQAYKMGRIEQSMELLKTHTGEFPRTLTQSVYRLLSLCNLALDQTSEAERYASLLLADDPYYSPSMQDPQRFKDIIDNIRAGLSATITSASSQAEKLDEVPVPTTLITEDMIKSSGARNLQEVLAAYVPGMHIIDCNDDINIAMRGIYSNGQEKILIMLNGHRLNSYVSNIAAPDFSIALDKLKQIEVLRGPASSLYGGVSLTAVVNLVTKQGAEIDGVRVKAGIGSHSQFTGSAMLGKHYFDLDLLVWGSFYMAGGQKVHVDAEETGRGGKSGDAIVGKIGGKPSYDVGAAIQYKNLRFLYNTQFSQVVSPLSMSYLFEPYDLDRYKTYNGVKPSFTTLSHHADLSYGQQLKNFYLKGNITYDNSDMTHYQVISDDQLPGLSKIIPLKGVSKDLFDSYSGTSRYISGQEHTFGLKLQADWNYVKSEHHNGLLSAGVEYNYFKLDDCRYIFGYNFTSSMPENDIIARLGKGSESNENGYLQLKHQWRSLILNAGLRYDFKTRYDTTYIRQLSPRVALIFLQPKWNVKLSYSKSFIDAPYLYRKTNLFLAASMSEENGEKLLLPLDPETLHSYQLTFGFPNLAKGLNLELNAFYNHAKDLIVMDLLSHYNSGNSDIYGLEFSGRYERRRFSAYLSAAWMKSSNYVSNYMEFDAPLNTPEISADAVLSWRPAKGLNVHGHLAFCGKQQTSYLNIANYASLRTVGEKIAELQKQIDAFELNNQPVPEELTKYYIELDEYASKAINEMYKDKELPAYLTVDLGANYTWRHLELSLNVKNLLNKKYRLGGAGTGIIPQRGRWLLFEVAYKF